MKELVVERLSGRAELGRLESLWNDLLAESGNDTIFLTFEWITSWLHWIGREAEPLVLLARNTNGTIVGIAPLMITDRRLEFIGAPNSDYSDFIVKGERTQVVRAFFDELFSNPRAWDSGALREIDSSSATVPSARKTFARPWLPALVATGTQCPTLIIDGHEDEIRAELARKKYIGKRDLAKSLAHVESVGPLKFRHCSTLDEARDLLPELFRMHRSRWADTDPSKFEDENYERFYYDLLDRLWPKGQVAVTAMELDTRPIGLSFAFPYKNTWTNHTWAYDREFSKLSPGTLLIQFMISDAVDRGYREFDFTRGAEPYKDRFANHVKQNIDLLIYDDRGTYAREWSGQMWMRGKERFVVGNPRMHEALRRVKRTVRR